MTDQPADAPVDSLVRAVALRDVAKLTDALVAVLDEDYAAADVALAGLDNDRIRDLAGAAFRLNCRARRVAARKTECMAMDIVEFLGARLDDDERAARAAGNRRWLVEDNMISLWPERDDDGFMSWPTRDDARHAARWEPVR
ncbi:DUF6221 family protein, partial [Actinomadura sp. RB99]|uniref:DUF6221 family protein n=1 Tax=Actinomadura sp. RB99 TaxID=2691577 RepID=UPI0019D64E3E